jgi:acetyltransferase
MGEASVRAARSQLRAAGLPRIRLPGDGGRGLRALAQFYRNQRAARGAAAARARRAPDLAGARGASCGRIARGRSVLGADGIEGLLAASASRWRARSCRRRRCAVARGRALGYPVAMKIDSPDITHKSDVGGVRLGLPTAERCAGALRDDGGGARASPERASTACRSSR